ncbi:MAG: ATP-binding cassette domain-containing protein [Deltaproteobacteria bacterium]|nr:ATP-binding cassette domain-containing protein [Deltaproteobacteria bacterium]
MVFAQIELTVAAASMLGCVPGNSTGASMKHNCILEAKNVYKDYPLKRKNLFKKPEVVNAVRGVSFSLFNEETFGVVGESGCGKSTLSRLLIMLEEPTRGEVLYKGRSIHEASRQEKNQLRKKVQLVLQDPYLSLPAWMKVGNIVGDSLNIHERKTLTKSEKRDKILNILSEVGLEESAYERYPLTFSAGQRQMINIARAIILNPEIVILDEAVSALDVSVQASILNLFADLRERRKLTYLLIAHDIGVVKHMCDRIAVMYLGRIVELAKNKEIFANALHPYTHALLNAVPTIKAGLNDEPVEVLTGEVPSPINIPRGCSFRSRCPKAMEICEASDPKWGEFEKGHFVECHLYS